MTAFTFSTAGIEPDQGRVGALPRGWYPTMVEKTEVKPNGNGTGLVLMLMFTVIHGKYKGCKFFTNFNVQHTNEQTMDIARKQLTALCIALGLPNGIQRDTDEMKNKPFFTRLKLVPATHNPDGSVQYEEKNEPTAYRNINDQMAVAAFKSQEGNEAPAAAPHAPVAAAPAAPPAPAPAWQAPAAAAPAVQAQAPAAAATAPQGGAVGSPPPAWQAPANAQPWESQPPAVAPAPAAVAPAPAADDDMPAWMRAGQ